MKKTIIFSVLFAFNCLFSLAQGFSVEKLKQGVWYKTTGHADEKTCLSFSDSIKHETYSIFREGRWQDVTIEDPYYLSNTKTQTFDFSKVGKGDSGKYLVKWNDTMKSFYALEIVDLTDNYLKIKCSNNDDVRIFRNEQKLEREFDKVTTVIKY